MVTGLKANFGGHVEKQVSENLTLFPNLAKHGAYWDESRFSGASQK